MTNERDDGGPAFPTEASSWEDVNNNTHASGGDLGMSLRDWFAGHALEALSNAYWEACPVSVVASRAYELADAMLKARQ